MRIALVAPDRTGKTTMANHLRDAYGFHKIDFTANLKQITADLSRVYAKHLASNFVTVHELNNNKEYWRQLLIDVGKLIQYDEKVWVRYMLDTADTNSEHYVFDNVRYNPQAVVLRQNGYLIVHLGTEKPRIDASLIDITLDYDHKCSVDVHCKHLVKEVAKYYDSINETLRRTPVLITPKQHALPLL